MIYWKKITKEQSQAILKLWQRDCNLYSQSYFQFRKLFRNYGDYVAGTYNGIFFGIEKDSYTHT